jgi:hypothetical protein
MKLTVLALLVALVASQSAHADEDSARPEPTVDVEMVWTDVRHGKVDLFVLVTNPNDFDVYIGRCGSSTTRREGSTQFGCGFVCTRPEDFVLLPARAKRLSQFHRGCELAPGANRFHIELSSSMSSDLPWNYVIKGNRVFDFVIVNPDTLSR